ncbi:MAG: hypothetical protein QF371_00680 [Flavobacteriales bacterium]|jgi:hypothetical protein|nr:hypothetical protein [Flavobacteriales bacterium]
MNVISKKKPFFPIIPTLRKYLKKEGREMKLGLVYSDLLEHQLATPLLDKKGQDTLWETVFYEPARTQELNKALTFIYVMLKNEGDFSSLEHLRVERIDYCAFGNSNPFRIRIVNNYNDNYDYFYIKTADASRVYGLELEHLLSPNRISYYVDENTLIEEHIAGIPGDMFIDSMLNTKQTNKVRLAKEFIKFNERCFVRLLGDMRSYNYVLDITPDFDDVQYRIRAIDFDQQCYEGRKNLYLPQFFKENLAMVELGMELINGKTVKQYQAEERSLIARRLIASRYRVKDLIDCMEKDSISPFEKIKQLREDLAKHHKNDDFLGFKNMGLILKLHLKMSLQQHIRKVRKL